jgi:hypothetical protein
MASASVILRPLLSSHACAFAIESELTPDFLVSAGYVGLPDKCPETTLCGHPRHRIHDTWNQSVAAWLELGFLGSLRSVAMLRHVCAIARV